MGRFDVVPGKTATIMQIHHANPRALKEKDDVVIVRIRGEHGLRRLCIPEGYAKQMKLRVGQEIEVAIEGDGRAFLGAQAATCTPR